MKQSRFEKWLGEAGLLSKYAVGLDKAASWVVALVGLVLAIITPTVGDGVSWIWIATIIGVNAVLLVIFGAFSAVLYAKQRHSLKNHEDKSVAKLKNEISESNHCIERLEKEKEEEAEKCELLVDTFVSSLESHAILTMKLLESTNAISMILNEWYEKLDKIQQTFEGLDLDKDDGGSLKKYYLGEYESAFENTRIRFFKEHKLFLRDVLESGRQTIEAYYRSQGRRYKVALCVKMFTEPDYSNKLIINVFDRNIFTGFRDDLTWSQERRQENPPQLFSVRGNTDFERSLLNGTAFVFNNETVGGTLSNESNYFGVYYNCGATVRIASKVRGTRSPAFVYGFLACDLLNNDESFEPIDPAVVNVLLDLRNILAAYYDQLNALWNYFNEIAHMGRMVDVLEEDDEDFASDDDSPKPFFSAYYEYLANPDEQEEV